MKMKEIIDDKINRINKENELIGLNKKEEGKIEAYKELLPEIEKQDALMGEIFKQENIRCRTCIW